MSSPRTRRSSPCATPRAPALANLAKLKRNFDAYGPGGFYDAVEVPTGDVVASATSPSTRA